MEPFKCGWCLTIFSREINIPKILDCGHTFCHLCISDFIYLKQLCHSCFKPIDESTEYNTNLFVLSHNDKYERRSIRLDIGEEEDTLKVFAKKIWKEKSLLQEDLRRRIPISRLITEEYEKISKMCETSIDKFDPKEVEKYIAALKIDINKIDKVLSFKLKPTYILEDFDKPSSFLENLGERYRSRKEFIYAYVPTKNSTPKFGFITSSKNELYVYAFAFTNIYEDWSLVSFEDLKRCITVENFRPFVHLGPKTLYFSITDSSFLASLFVKLCSGENGPSFIGAKFERSEMQLLLDKNDICASTDPQNILQEEIISVEMYKTNDINMKRFEDYNFSIFGAANKTICSVDDIVVQMNPNGSISIHKCPTESHYYENVVAKVKDQPDVFSILKQYNKITKCGLTFNYTA